MRSVLDKQGALQQVQAGFVAWTSQVSLDTLGGIAPREQAKPAYDHPVANWLSAQYGGM